MSLQRTVLITGANRGLGLEASRQLAASGAVVLMAARDLAKGKQAAESLCADGHFLDREDASYVVSVGVTQLDN